MYVLENHLFLYTNNDQCEKTKLWKQFHLQKHQKIKPLGNKLKEAHTDGEP